MLSSERGISALRLRSILGCSYKSAWFLEHRIRAAMALRAAALGPFVAYAGSGVGTGAAPGTGLPGWSLLRSLIAGEHRVVGARYLGAYWDEVRWRERQRRNPNAFRETVEALLAHPWLPYHQLTGRTGGNT